MDLIVGDLLDLVRARPAGEPVWTSLRRGFDVFGVPYHPEYAAPILRLVFGTPVLLAGYLRKLQEAQETVIALLVQRAEAAGTPYAPGDPAPRALTAAAFGCLVAAHHSWLESGAEGPFEAAIDRAMDAVRPPA
ncbi:hypothetical protein [Pseudosporangium ferrugineum]|uniref:MftR C-terminal domain-containing protein n=1 Tax=Pseudosporangium ferrugineum TaxID=439699 RepID=A0A2T0SEP1_9ACTN|nr:hypothetical protein [Pseudosporangium ferrugineum]PRY31888.1 hypothetical protein CLV70_10299 [Pseudosporangium ferrugineum]